MKAKKRTGEGGNKCKMGRALLMICVVGLVPYMPASSAMPSARDNPRSKRVSEALDAMDHIHSSIAEHMYGAELSIIGLVSTGIVESAKTGNSSNPHGMEVSKITNKTEHILKHYWWMSLQA
jgi:hypothetical protein